MHVRHSTSNILKQAWAGALLAWGLTGAWAATEEWPDVAAAEGWDNLPPAVAEAGDWPWWRGPSLNNHAATGQKPPLKWSETENVLWRVELPGKGHSTPCIRGHRIFVSVGDAQQQTISLLCLERDTGKKLWQTEVYHGPFPKIHDDNSRASATPACDGERVFVPYQTEDAVRLASYETGSEDDIGFALNNRLEEHRILLGVILQIGILNDHIGRRGMGNPGA